MSDVVEYVIKFREFGASKVIDGAREKVDRLNRSVRGTNASLASFGSIIAGIGLLAFGKSVVQVTSDFAKFKALLTNTLGTESQAVGALESLKQFAATTPFQIDEITASFVKLANQSFTPTMEELRKLGDLAAVTAKPIDQVIEALLDAQQGEFIRLKELSIRAQKVGDKIKFTYKGITTEVNYTSNAVKNYILSLGDLKGVTGAMASISKTLGGMLSNLGDSFVFLRLEIGQRLEPLFINLIEKAKNLMDGFVDLLKQTDGTAFSLANVAKWTGILSGYILTVITVTKLWTAAQWLLDAALAANPIGLVIAAIVALVAGIVWLYKNVAEVKAGFDAWFKILTIIGKFLYDVFAPGLKAGVMILELLFNKALENVIENFKIALDWGIKLISFLQKLAVFDWQKNLASQFKAALQEGYGNLIASNSVLAEGQQGPLAPSLQKQIAGYSPLPGLPGGGMAPFIPSQSPVGSSTASATTPSSVSSAAPRQFNINIENLVRQFTVSTANTIQASAEEVKNKMEQALMEAVADVQIAR